MIVMGNDKVDKETGKKEKEKERKRKKEGADGKVERGR